MTLWYIFRFYLRAFPALIRRQRLRPPRAAIRRRYAFSITPARKQAWHRLYGVQEAAARIPFTYYWPHCVEFFLHLINRLGVNYRNILHFRNEIQLLDPQALRFDSSEAYRVDANLDALIPYKDKGLLMVLHTVVSAARPIVALKEFILIQNVSRNDLDRVRSSPLYQSEATSAALLSRLDTLTNDDSTHCRALDIPARAGQEYARVSGDMNPVHTHPRWVRYFGYDRIFVQGLYTVNLLLKVFCGDAEEALKKMTVAFRRPLYPSQTVKLMYDETRFVLCDAAGQALVVGERMSLQNNSA